MTNQSASRKWIHRWFVCTCEGRVHVHGSYSASTCMLCAPHMPCHLSIIIFTHIRIALLLGVQLHNADQLSSWCLHFISSNYLAYVEQESFSMLQDENLDHVTTHRWPPVSYEQEMQEYRIKYLEEEGEEKKEKGRRKKFSLRGRMNHLF